MNNLYSNVIDHNYRSIEHALKVTHALEREDSGILMLFLGNREEGVSVIESADSTIALSMIEIEKNATEPGEEALIEIIEYEYKTYSRLLDSVITNNVGNDRAVYKSLHSQFTKTKKTVTNLMELN